MNTETRRASSILPGELVYNIVPATVRGPRGGRYRFDGLAVGARVVSAARVARGFEIAVQGKGLREVVRFVLPGNLADLVDATVAVEGTPDVRSYSDEQLLAIPLDRTTPTALRLAVAAELDRRTNPSKGVRP